MKPLPCPFCGNKGDTLAKPISPRSYFHADDLISVVCWACESQGPVATTDDEAIKAWNRAQRKDEGKHE